MRSPVYELEVIANSGCSLKDDEIGLHSKMYEKIFQKQFDRGGASKPSKKGIVRVDSKTKKPSVLSFAV